LLPVNLISYKLSPATYAVAIIDEYGDDFATLVSLSAGQTKTVLYDGDDDLVLRSEKAKQNTQLLETSNILQIIKDEITNGEAKLLKVE